MDLWKTFTFDTGLYSLRDINRALSMFTSNSNNGNDPKLIQFSADQATSKIYDVFSQPHISIALIWSAHTMTLLGFDISQKDSNSSIGNLPAAGSVKSLNQAQLNSLQNILIKCDAVTGSYLNTQESNVIASVPVTKRN